MMSRRRAPSARPAAEEGPARPTGLVRRTIRVPDAHIKALLADPGHTPLRPLSEGFVREMNPRLRENLLASAAAVLSGIAKTENILLQFFRKGFAVMVAEVDYDYQPPQGARGN